MTGRAFANVDWWEHRADRSYDEQDPACVIHPNGTQIASFDRAFIGAAAREVLCLMTLAGSSATEQKEH